MKRYRIEYEVRNSHGDSTVHHHDFVDVDESEISEWLGVAEESIMKEGGKLINVSMVSSEKSG